MIKLKAQSPKAPVLFALKARLIQRSALQACFFAPFRAFYIFQKKENQNWIKTIGSWHYWYKPLILHIFSVTYLSKKRKKNWVWLVLKPNPQPPKSSLLLFFLLETVTHLAPWYQLPCCNVLIFLAHSWKKKKYDIIYVVIV